MFSRDVASDIYGKQNGFRQLTSKLAQKKVASYKWPTMFKASCAEQVPLFATKNKQGDMLATLCAKEYPDLKMIQACNKYLVVNYLCYVEIPMEHYNKNTNRKVNTYQKRIITCNLDIIAEWMGIDKSEAERKYSNHLLDLEYPQRGEENMIPFLELKLSKSGEHKISKPRKKLNLSNNDLNVNPVYMLKASVDTLYKHLTKGICKVTYKKDNGMMREIATTMQKTVMAEIYGLDSEWYHDMEETIYNGKFLENDALFRGYIRIPEIGGSKYDAPTRSLNFNRVCTIEPNFEPDTSLIDIDLSTTKNAFANALTKHPERNHTIRNLLDKYDYGKGALKSMNLIFWEEEMESIHTTQFKRFIGKFMMDNKDLFDGYDGSPTKSADNSLGIGLVDDLADFDFELE